MKHCMFLFFFCSDGGVILNYSWYVKYWKNKPGQKRHRCFLCSIYKKEKSSWSPPFTPGDSSVGHVLNFLCAVWGPYGSVGAAGPEEEKAGLLRTYYWSSHAMLSDWQ